LNFIDFLGIKCLHVAVSVVGEVGLMNDELVLVLNVQVELEGSGRGDPHVIVPIGICPCCVYCAWWDTNYSHL